MSAETTPIPPARDQGVAAVYTEYAYVDPYSEGLQTAWSFIDLEGDRSTIKGSVSDWAGRYWDEPHPYRIEIEDILSQEGKEDDPLNRRIAGAMGHVIVTDIAEKDIVYEGMGQPSYLSPGAFDALANLVGLEVTEIEDTEEEALHTSEDILLADKLRSQYRLYEIHEGDGDADYVAEEIQPILEEVTDGTVVSHPYIVRSEGLDPADEILVSSVTSSETNERIITGQGVALVSMNGNLPEELTQMIINGRLNNRVVNADHHPGFGESRPEGVEGLADKFDAFVQSGNPVSPAVLKAVAEIKAARVAEGQLT